MKYGKFHYLNKNVGSKTIDWDCLVCKIHGICVNAVLSACTNHQIDVAAKGEAYLINSPQYNTWDLYLNTMNIYADIS